MRSQRRISVVSIAARKVAVFMLISAPMASLYAQETVNSASLSGRVTDPAGAVLQSAEVSVRQIDTNLTHTVSTGQDGGFRFPYLQLGEYEITVKKKDLRMRSVPSI